MIALLLILVYIMAIIVFHIIWLIAIVNHDGKCHYDDCGHCPYDGYCPMQEERENDID